MRLIDCVMRGCLSPETVQKLMDWHKKTYGKRLVEGQLHQADPEVQKTREVPPVASGGQS